jgi:hypothetical protein
VWSEQGCGQVVLKKHAAGWDSRGMKQSTIERKQSKEVEGAVSGQFILKEHAAGWEIKQSVMERKQSKEMEKARFQKSLRQEMPINKEPHRVAKV